MGYDYYLTIVERIQDGVKRYAIHKGNQIFYENNVPVSLHTASGIKVNLRGYNIHYQDSFQTREEAEKKLTEFVVLEKLGVI